MSCRDLQSQILNAVAGIGVLNYLEGSKENSSQLLCNVIKSGSYTLQNILGTF